MGKLSANVGDLKKHKNFGEKLNDLRNRYGHISIPIEFSPKDDFYKTPLGVLLSYYLEERATPIVDEKGQPVNRATGKVPSETVNNVAYHFNPHVIGDFLLCRPDDISDIEDLLSIIFEFADGHSRIKGMAIGYLNGNIKIEQLDRLVPLQVSPASMKAELHLNKNIQVGHSTANRIGSPLVPMGRDINEVIPKGKFVNINKKLGIGCMLMALKDYYEKNGDMCWDWPTVYGYRKDVTKRAKFAKDSILTAYPPKAYFKMKEVLDRALNIIDYIKDNKEYLKQTGQDYAKHNVVIKSQSILPLLMTELVNPVSKLSQISDKLIASKIISSASTFAENLPFVTHGSNANQAAYAKKLLDLLKPTNEDIAATKREARIEIKMRKNKGLMILPMGNTA